MDEEDLAEIFISVLLVPVILHVTVQVELTLV